MPGSGKSTVSKFASEYGFDVINMGDMIRKEAIKQYSEITTDTLFKTMVSIRKENGEDAVAKLCLPQINSSKKSFVFIDGIRSIHEINFFKTIGYVKLLSIKMSKQNRKKLLLERKRVDYPINDNLFDKRDDVEIKLGVSNIINQSDKVIYNDNLSLVQLKQLAFNIFSKWDNEYNEESKK